MSSRFTSKFIDFAKRHPVIAGMVFMVVGLLMAKDSIKTGTYYAEFSGGDVVIGAVIKVENTANRPILPNFQLEASWEDSFYQEHIGNIKIFKGQYENLKPGDEVMLLLAADDPSRAMLKGTHQNEKIYSIGGIKATWQIFLGIGFFAFGLLMAVFRQKLIRNG
jgi:hypothetical protein